MAFICRRLRWRIMEVNGSFYPQYWFLGWVTLDWDYARNDTVDQARAMIMWLKYPKKDAPTYHKADK